MNIKVFQICSERDKDRVKFMDLDTTTVNYYL